MKDAIYEEMEQAVVGEFDQNNLRNWEIVFSNHAIQRMEKRNIILGKSDLMRLSNGFDKIASKGANEAVILKDETAFIVNVKNKKVITTMNAEQLKEKVFTNIDSVVIV